MSNEYSLYTHPKLVAEITDLFKNNAIIKHRIQTAYDKFLTKYPPKNTVFNFSVDTDTALNRAFNLMDSVEELSANLPKIKSREFSLLLIKHFQELGGEAYKLYSYHRKSFQENEEGWNDVRKLPQEDAEFIIQYFYAKLSDYLNYTDQLIPLGDALKKYSKFSPEKIVGKLSSFKLKGLKNTSDAFDDFEGDYLITSQEFGDFKLFTNNTVVYKGKKTFKLEPKLWRILLIFLQYPNSLLGIEFIVNILEEQGKIEPTSNIKYISKLQKALKTETSQTWITNTRGKGWIFNLE